MKKILKNKFAFYLALLLAFISLTFPVQAENQYSGNQRVVTIDFDDVDIRVFIKFIGELTGTNFLIDPQIKGKVTIISPERISAKEAYKVFESVLDVHGYAAVKAGKITKIMQKREARSQNIETKLRQNASAANDKLVTQIIRLTYSDPVEMSRILRQMVSRESIMVPFRPTNTLIITDIYSNIIRVMKIIKALDIKGIGRELSVIPLRFADCDDVSKALQSVFSGKSRIKGEAPQIIKFVPDARTNSIILLANEIDTRRVKSLIKVLDKEVHQGKAGIHVYYLEHATAEDLAKVLNNLPKDGKGKANSVISDKVTITPDKATNSLIIMAKQDDYSVVEEVVKKLDIPRAMVYIECLIVEVNVNKDFNLGTEWSAAGKTNYGDKQGGITGGFSGSDSPYSSIRNLEKGTLTNTGFLLGTFTEAIKIAGIEFPSLSAVINAYKKDKDVQILSTPQILTTDNQEAEIITGKTVPYQTQSAASGTSDAYNSYEYKDVGITLKITPQISKDRLVRLKIFQEVNKLDSGSNSADRPTTLKRKIDTTVIVEDKNTVVIGGLIDDSLTETIYKVPCLGDIPLLGWLFKSKSKAGEKTNLFVFLTPHVLQNTEEASKLSEKKNKIIKDVKIDSIKMYK